MPVRGSITITLPAESQLIQPDSSIVLHGTFFAEHKTWWAMLIPRILGLNWRIMQNGTGRFWFPSTQSFEIDNSFWPAGGNIPVPLVLGEPTITWNVFGHWTGAGEWQTAIPNSRQLDLGAFPDGSYTLEVELIIRGMAQKRKRFTDSVTFEIDSQEPSLNITSPGSDRMVDAPYAVFAGTMSDEEGEITSVRYSIQDVERSWEHGKWWDDQSVEWTNNEALHDAQFDADSWSAVWAGGGFGSGRYLLKVIAADEAGNTSTQMKPFFSNFGRPVLAFASPANGADDVAGSILINGTVRSRNWGYVRVVLEIQDAESGLWWDIDREEWSAQNRLPEAHVPNNDDWVVTFFYEFPSDLAHALGGSDNYQVTATPYQPAVFSPKNGDSQSLTFTVNYAPKTSIDVPEHNSILPALPRIFAGRIEDSGNVERVVLTLFNKSENEFWNGSSWQAQPFELEAKITRRGMWEYRYEPIDERLGEFRLFSWGYDKFGNRSESSGVALFTVE